MKKTVWLTAIICMRSFLLPAQEVRNVLVKMNETYFKAASFSMNVKVSLYEKGYEVPEVVQQGFMKKQGNDYTSCFNGKTTIVNKEHIVLVDDNMKIIAISPLKGKMQKSEMSIGTLLDSGLFARSTVKLLAKTEKTETIEVIPKDGFYTKVEAEIDLQTFTLSKITFYYSTDAEQTYERMVVEYSRCTLNEKIGEAAFGTTLYLSKHSGTYEGVGKYSAYKIIDETDIKPFTHDED